MNISSCRPADDYAMYQLNHTMRPLKAIILLILIVGVTICATSVTMLVQKRSSSGMVSSGNEDKLMVATANPSLAPHTARPASTSLEPTLSSPSSGPSQSLSAQPSAAPSSSPSMPPSDMPSSEPSSEPSSVRFYPGKLASEENGLILSEGLVSRIVASSQKRVLYANGTFSTDEFHPLPDFGAAFEDPDNPGGWIYVSNSEVRNFTLHPQGGGVGALTFDEHGRVTSYRMILSGTTANCGGGKTPWGAWISCEEHDAGKLWQVDPTGARLPNVLTLGKDGGAFESFAYDSSKEQYFVTEDAPGGPLRRFSPASSGSVDPWNILLGPGEVHFLLLHPNETGNQGRYDWTNDRVIAKENSKRFYQHSEGIDVFGRELRFVSKNWKSMFILNLDDGTYFNTSTVSGLMDGAPDQLQRISEEDDLLFFTEEGGQYPGVHALNKHGEMITLLESPVYKDESTGLAFSPDGRHLYFAFQETGILFDITREDGLPFHGRTMNARYHASD